MTSIAARCNPRQPSSADLALEAMAYDEALARERIASLEADCAALRLTLHEAVAGLYHVTLERERLRDQLTALRDEYRALRERLLVEAGVAA